MNKLRLVFCIIPIVLNIGCDSDSATSSGDPAAAQLGVSPGEAEPTELENTFAIGGVISNMQGEIGLKLNNGAEQTVSTHSFFFLEELLQGETYDVAITRHPAEQLCMIKAGSTGSVNQEDVTDIQIECIESTLVQTSRKVTEISVYWPDTPDEITIYTYDKMGKPLSKKIDNNDDGLFNEITDYLYDDKNNLLTEKLDHNADGAMDAMVSYRYDSNGSRIEKSTDSDLDGLPDEIIIYTYDESQNRIGEGIVIDTDGNIDEVTSYTYDADGKMLTLIDHTKVDFNYDFIYDADGKHLSSDQNFSLDNSIYGYVACAYNDDGKILSEERHIYSEWTAPIVNFMYHTYDMTGKLLSTQNKNITNSTTTYSYSGDMRIRMYNPHIKKTIFPHPFIMD